MGALLGRDLASQRIVHGGNGFGEPALARQEFGPHGVPAPAGCEYLPTPELVEYRAFPRLCALAEVGWSSTRDYHDFHARLRRHLPALDAMGVNYRPLD